MDSQTPKRERKGIHDLYFEILGTHPEISQEIEDALLLAASENMQVKIALRTCSIAKDDIEIKCFEHTGRYLDCGIYPVFGLLKLPHKEKEQPQPQPEKPTQSDGDGTSMQDVSSQEARTSRPPIVYEQKLIVDGNHRNIINDLLDTFNSEREDFARKRISKMDFIKEKIGVGQVPMLYDLMFKGLKHIIDTIVKTVRSKERYDALRVKISEAKRAQSIDPDLLDWSQMAMDEIEDEQGQGEEGGSKKKNPNAKYFKAFPGWYTETIKNPKFKVEIVCQLNFYCMEGVYESIACGLIFYEMLRLFQLDKYVVRRENKEERKYPSVLDLFQENSGYYYGKMLWDAKRAKVAEKREAEKRKMALEAQNGMMEGDGAMIMEPQEENLGTSQVMEVDQMIEV
jgi:hypothetical protein